VGRSTTSAPGAAWTPGDLAGDPHAFTDKAERVRRMFGAIAGRYDLNNRVHSFGRDQAWRRRAARLARVARTDRVLDCACGTGDLAEAFADAGAAAVCGVDFTAEMIELARRKAARRRRRAGTCVPEYRLGDAMDLPFAEAAFDVVSIAFGIRNVSDPGRAVAEFRRVLRPGGRLVVLEFSEPENRLLRAVNRLYCGTIMPVTAAFLAGDRSGAYRYLPKSVATFAGRDALAGLIGASGFGPVAQHPMTFGVCVAYVAELSGVDRVR
jgi:demethylmenaquinone methyltransferase/2-methoxy-6-polyprenyl-1,4-benzoquinol methylase